MQNGSASFCLSLGENAMLLERVCACDPGLLFLFIGIWFMGKKIRLGEKKVEMEIGWAVFIFR